MHIKYIIIFFYLQVYHFLISILFNHIFQYNALIKSFLDFFFQYNALIVFSSFNNKKLLLAYKITICIRVQIKI